MAHGVHCTSIFRKLINALVFCSHHSGCKHESRDDVILNKFSICWKPLDVRVLTIAIEDDYFCGRLG